MIIIDQGNSSAKIAFLTDSGDILRVISVKIPHDVKIEGFCEIIEASGVLEELKKEEKMYLSSVVLELTSFWVKTFGATVVDGTWELPIKCINKEQRGTDRLMAAVAATERPAIIINLGTATVVDAVSRDNEFLGGMIAPGIMTGIEALAEKTSRLFEVKEIVRPEKALANTNTRDTLLSGIFYHTIGSITAMAEAALKETGESTTIYITGGMAEVIAPYLPFKVILDRYLVIKGVYLVIKHNGM